MSNVCKLICEAPLLINIQNNPYSVVMRMPGNEVFHAAGFCLSERIVDTPEDIIDLYYNNNFPEKGINVLLNKKRYEKILPMIDKKRPVVQSDYGVCARVMADKVCERTAFLNKKIDMDKVLYCVNHLSDHQPIRSMTKAAHAAAAIDSNYNFISVFEDVGRHNALDKVIGKAFLENRLKDIFFLVLSSRISYELVQKAVRAGISSICAVSKPTDLAVEIAKRLNMTLACLSKKSGMDVFSGEDS